ncbi:MAG: SDR family NAD(P)-dependent oxidoreductase [Terriglobales bacterium]
MADETYALITGASMGIGAALARALAREGRRLILTGRNLERLERVAAEAGPGAARVVAADLRTETGVDQIEEFLAREGLRVDLLINNAGFGSGGDFSALPLERELQMLDVNLRSLVELTHRHLARMRERGGGAIVNVASTAAFQPVPYMAAYSASKAFVLHFSLALWQENRGRGVHVMALCPGTTRTGFFTAAGISPDAPYSQSAEAVAALALRGLARRRPLVICGWPNRLMVAGERVLPRRFVAAMAARYMRPRVASAGR